METLKNTLLTNWSFMRWFRLGLALFIAFQAYELNNGLLGLFSAFILFQALSNTGCCGSSGCSVNPPKTKSNYVEDIQFEEIKEDTNRTKSTHV